jgi:hypothetical protein
MVPRELEQRAGVRLCALQYHADRIEACPEADCPFWDDGCLIERLDLDLEARPELAHALLQVRRRVEQAVTAEDRDGARSLFYRLVPRARTGD